MNLEALYASQCDDVLRPVFVCGFDRFDVTGAIATYK